MEGITLVSPRSVLIVDRSEESREVLKTALERRGLRILEASRAWQGAEMARKHDPDLIVLDMDSAGPNAEEACAPLAAQSEANCTPLVVIGAMRRTRGRFAHGQFVAKPYHYGPLILKIEELLHQTSPLVRSA
jgi:two-component system phosphate regulon response regulator PhoB